jgi:3-phosphoshikimate 1-carboxyvinyltransferase
MFDRMADERIEQLAGPFEATMTPPGSKSLTNRALVLAALSTGECVLDNVLFADDTQVMLEAMTKLGFAPKIDETARRVTLTGRGGEIPSKSAELFIGNSGTTVRFLTAMLTAGRGVYTLDGVPRMRQRPIGPLLAMLKNLGARVSSTMEDGFPPVRVDADKLAGGLVRFGAESSSQYLSAVLQVAPCARNEVRVYLGPNQTSWPYVEMTVRLMDHFGCTPMIERDTNTGEPKVLIVPRELYQPTTYAIEPDASNATYFLALAAAHPGSCVTVKGLGTTSLQGDAGFYRELQRAGIKVEAGADFIRVHGPDSFAGFDTDLSTMPDTAQTLAVLALFAEEPSTIRGLHTLRVKETDRIAALQKELTKLGAEVRVDGDDALHITPPKTLLAADIDTYDDHRMAMSFAIAATRRNGVVIKDAHCVNKTYPGFFADLRKCVAG